MAFSITILIIAVTALVSLASFSNPGLLNRLIFYPYRIKRQNTWQEFITHGFIHADTTHLLFNMITLYFFGGLVEDRLGTVNYLLLYFVGMAMASVFSYFKHQNNTGYRALGASGAVSAVLFAAILIRPEMSLYIFFIPIPIPALIFGPLYLLYSAYEARKGTSNVGHDAHFYGAIFGLIFPLIVQPSLFQNFLDRLPHAIPFLN